MKIPILNIYYLLCYAWDILPEGDVAKVGESDFQTVLDFLSNILINGCSHLLKRGLDRSYIEACDAIYGTKGKIDFSQTLKTDMLAYGRTECHFDEFDHNVIHNQIIRSTVRNLLQVRSLDSGVKLELVRLFKRFHEVSVIEIKKSDFAKVKIHRNNSYYRLLLNVCRLVFESIIVEEKRGELLFQDFSRNEKKMAKLFQDFVFNFFRREQSEYTVVRERILWNAIPVSNSSMDYLPAMYTDISLVSAKRKIIIDTKYYSQTFSIRYDTEKIHSANLFQLYSYLKNVKDDEALRGKPAGILIYPAVNQDVLQTYLIDGHKIAIATIDLSKPWIEIEASLKRMLTIT